MADESRSLRFLGGSTEQSRRPIKWHIKIPIYKRCRFWDSNVKGTRSHTLKLEKPGCMREDNHPQPLAVLVMLNSQSFSHICFISGQTIAYIIRQARRRTDKKAQGKRSAAVRVWRPLEKKSTANQRKYKIMLKSTFNRLQRFRWLYGSIFICLAVVASQICEILRNSERIRSFRRSRSSKVIDLSVNRKRM